MSPSLIPHTLALRADASWGARALVGLACFEPRPSDRVFFLLYPPRIVAERIRRIGVRFCERFHLPGRPPAAEMLHVSLLELCAFGELTAHRLDAVAGALADLAMPRFLAGFGRIMHFGRDQGPLVLCGDEDSLVGIRMLQRELVDATRPTAVRQGARDETRGFTPHVTLNYGDCSMPKEPEVIEEICWQIADIALVCSLRGRRRHVELGRWPLACRPLRTATVTN